MSKLDRIIEILLDDWRYQIDICRLKLKDKKCRKELKDKIFCDCEERFAEKKLISQFKNKGRKV